MMFPNLKTCSILFNAKQYFERQLHGARDRRIPLSISERAWFLSVSTVRSRNSIDVLLSFANGPKAFTGGKMGKKLYVGNLSYSMDDQSLTNLFSTYGNVESARVITDRETGRSKGFAFVEMSADSEAQSAIEKLNGTEQSGRAINVSEAKPMEPRGDRGGGGGRGGFSNNRRPRY